MYLELCFDKLEKVLDNFIATERSSVYVNGGFQPL